MLDIVRDSPSIVVILGFEQECDYTLEILIRGPSFDFSKSTKAHVDLASMLISHVRSHVGLVSKQLLTRWQRLLGVVQLARTLYNSHSAW